MSEPTAPAAAMSQSEQLAAFAGRAAYDDLSEAARRQLKIRVLDALGCAIGALDGEPVRLIRAQLDDFGGGGPCTLIGGGRTAPGPGRPVSQRAGPLSRFQR